MMQIMFTVPGQPHGKGHSFQHELHDLFEYKNGDLFWKKSLSNRAPVGKSIVKTLRNELRDIFVSAGMESYEGRLYKHKHSWKNISSTFNNFLYVSWVSSQNY